MPYLTAPTLKNFKVLKHIIRSFHSFLPVLLGNILDFLRLLITEIIYLEDLGSSYFS